MRSAESSSSRGEAQGRFFLGGFRPRAPLIPTCLLIALCVVGEGFLRLSGVHKPWEFSQGAYYKWDSVLFWRLKPGFDSVVDSVRVRVNPDGFRGPSIGGWDSQALKIICFGDSVTFGYGAEDESAFPNRLEQELKARGTPTSAMNAGVPGYSALQIQRYLQELRPRKPDLLIVSLGGLAEGSATFDGLPDDQRATGWMACLRRGLDRSALFVFLSGLLQPAKAPRHPAERESLRTRKDVLDAVTTWYAMTRRLSPESYARALETILDAAHADGIRVIFLAVPVNPYRDPGPPSPNAISDVSSIDRFLQAKDAADRGLLAPALDIFKDLHIQYPDMAPVQFEIAMIAAAMGDWGLACPSYRAAYERSAMRERVMEYQRVGIELAAKRGAQVVQMEPLMEPHWFQPQQTESDLFLDFCHPTPKGHAMIAQALADAILIPE